MFDIIIFLIKKYIAPHLPVVPKLLVLGFNLVMEVDGVNSLSNFVFLSVDDDYGWGLNVSPLTFVNVVHDIFTLSQCANGELLPIHVWVILQVVRCHLASYHSFKVSRENSEFAG